LLDKRDYDRSIDLKTKSLELLNDALAFDTHNSLPKVIQRVENVLKTLKEKKDHAAIRKLVDYEACCEEEDDDWGYMCRSDSDDGCYSDEDLQDADLVDFDDLSDDCSDTDSD